MKFTVGQSVWRHDVNRRVYIPESPGSTWQKVDRRQSYERVTITGETRKSWLVGKEKYDKESGVIRDNYGHSRLVSDERMEAETWRYENVAEFIAWIHADPINMKRAAEAVGWAKETSK